MKNESVKQAVAPEVAPLENKNRPFWVVVDENNDIVQVMHPDFGVMKAVFGEEEDARKALEMSRKADISILWQVMPAAIIEAEKE